MLVVEDLTKGSGRLCFHPYIESVTVRKFGFIEAMLSKERDACFPKIRST